MLKAPIAQCFGLVGILQLVNAAVAEPVQWALQDVEFDDGGAAVGLFSYDVVTDEYSDVMILTAGGSSGLPGTLYEIPAPRSSYDNLSLGQTTGEPTLFLKWEFDLTDVKSSVNLDLSVEGICSGGPGCSFGGPNRQTVSGYAVLASEIEDTDEDSLPNQLDNCVLQFNPAQRDTDGDGIGNACDADFDQNCVINFIDLGIMKAFFFLQGDFDTDINGDGSTNFVDLASMKAAFFEAPGPSGTSTLCLSQ